METYHSLIHNHDEISLTSLRELIQQHEPPATLRPVVWKLLLGFTFKELFAYQLGYLPTTADRFEILKIKRRKYHNLAKRYSNLSQDHLYEQIHVDAIRTHVKKYKNLFELAPIQQVRNLRYSSYKLDVDSSSLYSVQRKAL
jgi:hypothetical protein